MKQQCHTQQHNTTALAKRLAAREENKHFARLKWITLVGIITMVIGVIGALYATFRPAQVVYFAVTSNHKLTRLYPLNEPVYSNVYVGQFVKDAMMNTFNYSFYHWKEHFRKMSQRYFTPDAMSNLLASWNKSSQIQQMINNQYIIRTVVLETPIVMMEKIVQKPHQPPTFIWVLQTKILQTVTNSVTTASFPYNVSVTVQRVSKLDNPSGLRIVAIQADRATEND